MRRARVTSNEFVQSNECEDKTAPNPKQPDLRPNVLPNWLSFHPDNRNRFRSMPAVVAASVIERKDSLYALWGDVIRTPQVMLDLNDSRLLDGAKWSRRETPADPFEVTG